MLRLVGCAEWLRGQRRSLPNESRRKLTRGFEASQSAIPCTGVKGAGDCVGSGWCSRVADVSTLEVSVHGIKFFITPEGKALNEDVFYFGVKSDSGWRGSFATGSDWTHSYAWGGPQGWPREKNSRDVLLAVRGKAVRLGLVGSPEPRHFIEIGDATAEPIRLGGQLKVAYPLSDKPSREWARLFMARLDDADCYLDGQLLWIAGGEYQSGHRLEQAREAAARVNRSLDVDRRTGSRE